MKKFLIGAMLFGVMTFTFTGCGGNKMAYSTSVPNNVLSEFHDMYPAADDVRWKLKDGLYQADFEISGKDMKAVYTADGNLVRIDS
ncbi:MAG: hypothetical protein K2X86_17150 [Cytophagaceae bacterium]|nr:hypothetical protein [Cytophagaceae bacterium]